MHATDGRPPAARYLILLYGDEAAEAARRCPAPEGGVELLPVMDMGSWRRSHAVAEAHRTQWGRVLATTVRLTLAQECTQDAYLRALEDPAVREAVAQLDPDAVVDVPLRWQRWKVRSPGLERLTDVVLTAGRRSLRQR